MACDLGEAISDAKERMGYSRIVLAGWSGGGSLSMWYQALAEAGTGISDTAAGDPYVVDPARMPAADAIMMLAAHVSRHQIFTEWIDPSIHDESRPDVRDPVLNLYDPSNPNQPPYSADFLATFASAQVTRNRRITAWVKERLAAIRASDSPQREFAFTVHGTMADPRWLDPTIEPSERAVGRCYLGDPKVVNDGPVGLARFCTLRSWLSQWSYDDARCDAVAAGPKISIPVLVVGNSADDACTPSHTRRLFEAVAHDSKRLHIVQGASHYYTGPDPDPGLRSGRRDRWLPRCNAPEPVLIGTGSGSARMTRPVAATGVYVDICGGPASNAMNAGMTVSTTPPRRAPASPPSRRTARRTSTCCPRRGRVDLHSFELGGRGD